VSTELRDIVTRCQRKSRADRFQSAAELRAALESASSARAPDAEPYVAVLPFANMSRAEDNEYSIRAPQTPIVSDPVYSSRSTCNGSTLAARQAGTTPGIIAIAPRISAAETKAQGSVGLIP